MIRDSIMVIGAHPDDEILGAGGLMLRAKDEGKKIHWLNATNMSVDYGFTSEQVERRTAEIDEVKELLQVDVFTDFGLKPAALDRYELGTIVGKISKEINRFRPEMIVLPYRYDVHSDHRVLFDAAYSCTKSFRYPFIKKIMMMEIPSETDFTTFDTTFTPNYFIDISNYLTKKNCLLSKYKGEIGQHPFPRSEKGIEALATLRGAQAGCFYAEAFLTLKEID